MTNIEKIIKQGKIHWVCGSCGELCGNKHRLGHMATFHIGVCDVCGLSTAITEIRDYGGLNERRAIANAQSIEDKLSKFNEE